MKTYKSNEELLQDNINNYLQAVTFSQANVSDELMQELQRQNFVWFLNLQIEKYKVYGTGQDIEIFLKENNDTIKVFEQEIKHVKQQISEGNRDVIREFSKKRTNPLMRTFTSESANA